MKHSGVAQFLYLLDEAFDGPDWHSLLGNLRSIREEDWSGVPQGGRRSIRDIIHHVGATKYVYHNHAFSDATPTGDTLFGDGRDPLAMRESAIAWLREGHDQLRQSLAQLDDAELVPPRLTPWGELRETRWIMSVMIQHGLYHAGEINHIRSLLQQHDCWEWEHEGT